jgi:5-methyltetrahydrofolate--homocysteine methyltransferase
MEIVKRLREELEVNTTCGASNLSFGLPNRNGLNSAFISMAIASGMTSAITNPLHGDLMQAVRGANVVMGHDPECAAWIHSCRDPNSGEGPQRGRRGGRRRQTERS